MIHKHAFAVLQNILSLTPNLKITTCAHESIWQFVVDSKQSNFQLGLLLVFILANLIKEAHCC